MVWPILISVAVTPRMSADIEAAGHASTATAPAAQTLETKRIDPLPRFILECPMTAAPGRLREHIVIKTCHVAGMDAIHNCRRHLGGDGWQGLRKLRNLPVVDRSSPAMAFSEFMRTKILYRPSRFRRFLCAAIMAGSVAAP